MAKHLVIVESAGKIKKINEYLGSDYIVKASFGHCMDLDKNTLSIDIENNYKPNYVITNHKVVNELKEIALKSLSVIIASDNDREGEAIAWSLASLLFNNDESKIKNNPRIIFTEITKKAILHAINNPTVINMNMVYAQQARRLLDRLVGYKISPLLKNINNAKSAGRVQSVVVKIINDKEKEITSSLLEPYFKTTCDLNYKKQLIKCNNDIKFKLKNDATEFLKLINKNSVFEVIKIDNKESISNPSQPFITSSLQQEASTKLKFNIKQTMDIAQKLYEAGHITYMRTDSLNLSTDAINNCKNYIITNFGEEYSNPKQYTSSNNAQEAHEAIRPTNINLKDILSDDKYQIKLYNLIWKRTIASQMTSAKINIQTIYIDTLNNNNSILNNKYWTSIYKNIIFEGYLKIYNNLDNDDETNLKKINININTILKFNKIKIFEEFNKLPLRFNEANLVKFLEKNNIGRPSTYTSVISKILERNYVEIKDITGINKQSTLIELNNLYNISESVNNIIIGNESKKIVPTELGTKTTEFLETNFNNIIQINFTADYELYLDKIAEGKATWFNVLNNFYKIFNPMVEKLKIMPIVNNIVGIYENENIYIGKGKYGPYIKYYNNYYSIPNDTIELEEAIKYLIYPKTLGKYNKCKIELYQKYIKHNKKNYAINNPETMTLENAIDIINNLKNDNSNNDNSNNFSNNLKNDNKFIIKDKEIYVKNGKYGPYLQILPENKNIPIPKNININKIDMNTILNILNK
jgi:DNA topoisomerase-1